MRRFSGVLLTITGVLVCPCHLIITLPLLVTLLTGTAPGHFLAHSTALVYTGAAIYFVVALTVGTWFLFGPKRGKRGIGVACTTCLPVEMTGRVPEQATLSKHLPTTGR